MQSDWNRRVVANGDVRIEVFDKGTGPAVLMHPSLGRGADDFLDLGDRVVAAGYRVVRVNPRGIGGSTGPMDAVTLHDLAADVWTVADDFGFDRIAMLGQNFGNRVSRTVSSDQPTRVNALILMAAGGEVEPDATVWEEFRKVFDPSLPEDDHMQAVAFSFFADGNDATVWRDGWYGQVAQQQTAAAQRTDFDPIYAGGTAPALVIQGLEDKIAPPINAWDFVNRRPDARLVAFPHMGHAMLPENPAGLASVVIDFLRGLDPAPR